MIKKGGQVALNPINSIIRAVSPEKALKREAARKKLSMIDSGYGNYGANSVKKSLIGWTHGGGNVIKIRKYKYLEQILY